MLMVGISPEAGAKRKKSWLILGYVGITIFMALITIASMRGIIPPFFIQGVGPTILREGVLGTAAILFAFSFLIFMGMYLKNGEVFLYWYSSALALTVINLSASLINKAAGSPIGWTARFSQYLGGIYLLIAIITAIRSAKARRISFDNILGVSFSPADEKFRALAENSPDIIVRFDRGMRHLYVNPEGLRSYGKSAGSIIGKTLEESGFPETYCSPWRGRIQKVFETGQPMEVEDYLPTEHGIRFYLSHCVPEYGVDGAVANVLVVSRDLTERKRAEEGLRRNQEWLRVTLTSIGDAVIATDTAGRITFLNPVAVTLTGWQAKEAVGQPVQGVFRIINEKTHEQVEDLIARVLNEKCVVGLANDTALVTKDGREVPIEDSAAPILDADGEVAGVVLVFHDVTAKRRAQAELREAHGRASWLARFPEENPNPVMQVSANGSVLYCNPAVAKLHRWECNVGQPLHHRLLPLVSRAMAEGKETQQDLQIDERFYFVWVSPFPEEGYANVYGREITERKRAEEALHASEEMLNRAEEIGHLGSWQLDLVHNRLSWSDEVYRIFGLKPQEFEATYEAFLQYVHPADRAAVDAAYSGSLREGRDTYEIEHRVIRKSTGEVRVVHEKGEHFRDASDRVVRSVGMVHDITERKQMEEELRRSRDGLELRVQERTEELTAMNEKLQTQIKECQRMDLELRKSEGHLRQLSSALLNAQEKERKRVAQEIHDSIGASLAATKYKVEATLIHVGDTDSRTTEALKSIIPILQGTIDEARRIQMALRPSILDDLGILATIGWFCRQYESTYSTIHVKQEINIEEHEMSDSLKTVIFRVLQEAMNNIAKHGKANQVLLALRKTDRAIHLVVRDNGHGFMVEDILSRKKSSRGLGLDSMRERTELAGGSFTIESTDSGTLIQASWPL